MQSNIGRARFHRADSGPNHATLQYPLIASAKGAISYQPGPAAQENRPKIFKGLKARPTPTSQAIPRLTPNAKPPVAIAVNGNLNGTIFASIL